MNYHIKRLAEQANATLNEGFDGNKAFVYGITMSPEELEKFAKLLIKETLMIAKVGIEYGPSMEQVVHKYFGVDQ